MADDSNRKPWPGIRIVDGKALPDTAEGDAAWAETWGIVDRSFLGETWAPSSKPTKR